MHAVDRSFLPSFHEIQGIARHYLLAEYQYDGAVGQAILALDWIGSFDTVLTFMLQKRGRKWQKQIHSPYVIVSCHDAFWRTQRSHHQPPG